MTRLDGTAAIVTGAGQEIGRGVARAFAREGAAVTIAEVNPETGQAVAKELEDELGAPALFVPTDVLDRDQVQHMVDTTVETFERVDVLVNNAYIAAPFARLEDKPGDDLLLAYRGGPLHTLWAMQAVFPHMVAQGGGRIVNFVSLNGINAHMYSADYNAAKEAIRALTRTAAREWAHRNILVNAIAPAAATPPTRPSPGPRRPTRPRCSSRTPWAAWATLSSTSAGWPCSWRRTTAATSPATPSSPTAAATSTTCSGFRPCPDCLLPALTDAEEPDIMHRPGGRQGGWP
jgi:NAD(P)-dependent dehydrogenase (short-subunit alcohol dehydrogenase family)